MLGGRSDGGRLSVASDRFGCSESARRSNRHRRPHPGRWHEAGARSGCGDREYHRCRRHGGGGHVAHATPDGYTIGIGNWTSHVGSAAIYVTQYDVRKDLQPISLIAYTPLWIVGKASLPPNNAAELISWVKSRSSPLSFGTVGAGSAAHLCGLYFQQKTGARFQYVPYRGAGPIIQDLTGGQIDLSCIDASTSFPSVAAGKIKAFAVLSETRWPKSPDTPTMIKSACLD